MTDSRALDPDRLPWLSAEPRSAVSTGWSLLVSWGVVVLLLVAGGAYWLGRNSEVAIEPETAPSEATRSTMTLPAPVVDAQQAPAAPTIELAPPPPASAVAPQRPAIVEHATASNGKAKPAKRVRAAERPARAVKKAAVSPTKAKRRRAASALTRVRRAAAVRRPSWPTAPTALYLGRMVQLGTYSTRSRLDRAWAYRLQRYPQLRSLPKVVVPYRTATGETRFQLQAMTAAPAQASWLCRKLRAEWRSCSILRPKTANG